MKHLLRVLRGLGIMALICFLCVGIGSLVSWVFSNPYAISTLVVSVIIAIAYNLGDPL